MFFFFTRKRTKKNSMLYVNVSEDTFKPKYIIYTVSYRYK